MKGITPKYTQLRTGTKFRVVSNRAGHNYEIGGVYTYCSRGSDHGTNTTVALLLNNTQAGTSAYIDDLALMYATRKDEAEALSAVLAEEEEQLADLRDRVTCLLKYDYDEDELVDIIATAKENGTAPEEIRKAIRDFQRRTVMAR